MVSDIVFPIATSPDAADVAQLVNTAYHGPEAAHGRTPETQLHARPRTSVAAVTGHILNPDCRRVLCQVSDGLIGCALIERHDANAHFGMFAVRPHLQGGGIGKAILTEAERLAAAQWQCRTMTMTMTMTMASISLQENLIAYYERRGYHRTGERLPFPADELAGALRTDYDLVVLRKALKPPAA